MELQDFRKDWKEQTVPAQLDENMIKGLDNFHGGIMRENTKVSYLFGATILIVGSVVLPFVTGNFIAVWLIAALFWLMGMQAFVFWMRSLDVQKSLGKEPEAFVRKNIRNLKYQLGVTNIALPIYMALLGLIMSFYMLELLPFLSVMVKIIVIGGLWAFLLMVFIVGWRNQRRKDQENVMPKLEVLEMIRNGYSEK